MKATKESPVGVMRAPRPARRKSNAAATGRRIRVNEVVQPEAARTHDDRLIEGQGSETSLEKSFFFGRRSLYKSDHPLLVGEEADMPDLYGLEQNLTRARSIPVFLSGSNAGYKNEVYVAAASIFEKLASRKEVGEILVQYPPISESSAVPPFSSPQTKRQSYELAYETLKYQELLEEIIADSGYLFSHPAGEDTSALLMVMLFDFQNRRWAPRCHIIGDASQHEVEELETSLMDHRVHLAAALARSRVKNQSQSIDYILPEDVRKQEKCAADLPQYAWINTMKMPIKDLIEHLEFLDYVEFVDTDILIPSRGKYYRRDRHCEDVVMFPADQKEALKALDVVEKGMMILQDKTSSLAVQSVAALLTGDDDGDLIHVEVASGLTTAHLAVVLYRKAKERKDTQDFMFHKPVTTNPEMEEKLKVPTVFAFGVKSDEHKIELDLLFEKLKIANIELSSERFEKVDPKKDVMYYAKVKVILLTPQCTRTAVANPIEFMLNEGDRENYHLLKDLSHGRMHKKAVEAGLAHTEQLKAALHFPDIKSVIYTTRSIHSQENEQVVNHAIKWFREKNENNRPFRVCPPTLPVLSTDLKDEAGSKKQLTSTQSLKHNFLNMRQNEQMNGCFIAVLVRELDPNDAAALRDMIKKAALQGLIVPDKQESTTTTSPVQSVKSFSVEQHRHHTPQKKVQKRTNVAKPTVTSHAKVTSPLKTSSHNIPTKKVVSTSLQKPLKPVESSDVDKMLSSYQKAQIVKTAGIQKVNTLEIGVDSSAKTVEKKGGTSIPSKELEFGKYIPKGKPNK